MDRRKVYRVGGNQLSMVYQGRDAYGLPIRYLIRRSALDEPPPEELDADIVESMLASDFRSRPIKTHRGPVKIRLPEVLY